MARKPRQFRQMIRSIRNGLRPQLFVLYLACSGYSTLGYSQPSSAEQGQPNASRAMLEFLVDFSELNDTEFNLLTAFAEQDARVETQPPDKLAITPSAESSTDLEQQEQTHE